jgi:virginiamycin A acetyltransferase
MQETLVFLIMKKNNGLVTVDEKIISNLKMHKLYLRPRFNYGNVLGKEILVKNNVYMEPYSRISETSLAWEKEVHIGAFSYVTQGAAIRNCKIGRFCSIGANLRIMGENHPINRVTTSTWTYGENLKQVIYDDFKIHVNQNKNIPYSKQTIIGNDVWIGEDVTIKPGVNIGDGSVIATNSTVVKDVEPYSILGGNPGKLRKYRFDSMTISRLLSSQWWNLSPVDLAKFDMCDIELFINNVDKIERKYEYPIYNLKDIFLG